MEEGRATEREGRAREGGEAGWSGGRARAVRGSLSAEFRLLVGPSRRVARGLQVGGQLALERLQRRILDALTQHIRRREPPPHLLPKLRRGGDAISTRRGDRPHAHERREPGAREQRAAADAPRIRLHLGGRAVRELLQQLLIRLGLVEGARPVPGAKAHRKGAARGEPGNGGQDGRRLRRRGAPSPRYPLLFVAHELSLRAECENRPPHRRIAPKSESNWQPLAPRRRERRHIEASVQLAIGGARSGAPLHYHKAALNTLVYGRRAWKQEPWVAGVSLKGRQ